MTDLREPSAEMSSGPAHDAPMAAARARYQQLIDAGWTGNHIAATAKVSRRQVTKLANGHDVNDHDALAIAALDPADTAEHPRWVPAEPAAIRIRDLIAQGAAGTKIAAAAGINHSAVSALRNGTAKSLQAATSERILAITIDQVRRERAQSIRVKGDTLDAPGRWQHDGACVGQPTELWFPEPERTGRKGGPGARYKANVQAAKVVCATCPVLDDCRDYITANPQPGIWGGTTERERRNARRSGAA